jgi:hypothetical protein
MKIILLMIILITSINSAFAQNAVKLNKGEVAPFTGALVKEERLDKLVKAEKSNIVLKDLRIAQDELIEYHKTDARKQREKLSDAKFEAFWTNAGYFVLGAVLTGLTFKLNQKIGDL